jgi:hypothetical protein
MAEGLRDLQAVVDTSENLPESPTTAYGSCTPRDPDDPWVSCLPARLAIRIGASPSRLRLPFSKFSGGVPHAGVSPGQLLGLALWFAWADGQGPYAVDVTLDDLRFE